MVQDQTLSDGALITVKQVDDSGHVLAHLRTIHFIEVQIHGFIDKINNNLDLVFEYSIEVCYIYR